MNRQIGIGFGVMSPPLAEQLTKQGFRFDAEKVKIWQQEIDAINRLRFGSNLLTDSMVDKMLPKLHKIIVKHICAKNKLKELK